MGVAALPASTILWWIQACISSSGWFLWFKSVPQVLSVFWHWLQEWHQTSRNICFQLCQRVPSLVDKTQWLQKKASY